MSAQSEELQVSIWAQRGPGERKIPIPLVCEYLQSQQTAVCDESLPSRALKLDFLRMATIAEVEKLALDLPETERAVLAAHLLGSLPSVLYDEDEGIAEALRRDAEFEANPSLGMSLEELDQRIESRRS